jgi:ArsR family transcriptional regulator, arsenate/arsenite/antimonite-responsive transcriptional repressor
MSVAAERVRTSERAEEWELAALAKALGHPARVRIVRLLLSRDACYCGEIVEELPLAQATVSQHLRVLTEAGLIRGEFEGPRTCYWADRERLASLHGLVGALLREAVALNEVRCGDDDD